MTMHLRANQSWFIWPLVVIGALLMRPCSSQLFYPSNGDIHEVDAVQAWYNGYWKHPGWINGTLVRSSCTDCAGKIHLEVNILAPYEPLIRKAMKKGAIALAVYRNRDGPPGQGMYFVTGDDQKDLTIPVVEIHQLPTKKTKNNLVTDALVSDDMIGIPVSIWPMENTWKKANDVTAFQVVLNVVLSMMEVAIFLIGLWRLHEWTRESSSRFFSIGPICILLEMISTSLRFADTVVDPFFTFRVYRFEVAMTLLTTSIPFLLCSGILLTFFWAETLRMSRIKASPFIAEFKKSAAVVIFLLFAGEIASTAVRILVPVTTFNPAYLAQAYYSIVSIVLIICYLLCAHQIRQRLSMNTNQTNSSNSNSHTISRGSTENSVSKKRKDYIRSMNLRFALSTIGYMLMIMATILSIPLLSYPWGWKIVLNLITFSLNFSGLLQVYSLQPPKGSVRSRSHSVAGARTMSAEHSAGIDILV